LVYSFATGGPVGPQMKPQKWSLDALGTHDEGLHKNAKEFDEVFLATFQEALGATLPTVTELPR